MLTLLIAVVFLLRACHRRVQSELVVLTIVALGESPL
jgi:hypothetical protein